MRAYLHYTGEQFDIVEVRESLSLVSVMASFQDTLHQSLPTAPGLIFTDDLVFRNIHNASQFSQVGVFSSDPWTPPFSSLRLNSHPLPFSSFNL